jgi:hypothetical protein
VLLVFGFFWTIRTEIATPITDGPTVDLLPNTYFCIKIIMYVKRVGPVVKRFLFPTVTPRPWLTFSNSQTSGIFNILVIGVASVSFAESGVSTTRCQV